MDSINTKENFYRKANAIGAIPLFITGLLFVLVGMNEKQVNGVYLYNQVFVSVVGWLGIGLLLLSVFVVFTLNKMVTGVRLLFFSTCGILLLMESLCWLLGVLGALPKPQAMSDCSFAVLTKPLAKVDFLTGYRWERNDSCRIARVVNGELVYNQLFRSNNRGYISSRNYNFEKNEKVKRFMVLGDSFTSGLFLQRNWVDYSNDLLNDGSTDIELYSFGVDGGGLLNWHYVFENEIKPNYDFDGIIMAYFGGEDERDSNFNRGCTIIHSDSTGLYFNWFDKPPKDEAEFQMNFRVKMIKIGEVMNESRLNEQLSTLAEMEDAGFGKMQFYTTNFIHNIVKMAVRVWEAFSYVGGLPFNKGGQEKTMSFQEKYGERKWKMLNDMMTWCEKNGKEVIWCNVPEEYGVVENLNGKRTVAQKELKVISKQYGAALFDGYAIFEKVREDDVRQYFLKNDGHWSTKGSDLFAERFVEWILNDTKLH